MRRPAYALMLVTAACAAWFTYDNVVDKPFGYVQMTYTDSIEDFNARPEVLKAKFGIALDAPPPPQTQWRRALDDKPLLVQVREAVLLAYGLQAIGSKTGKPRARSELFEQGPQYLRICSENAKIFAAAMQSIGVPARVIWMCGHTVAEVYDNRTGRWILVDPFKNLMFRQNGRLLSLLETVGNAGAIPERANKDLVTFEDFVVTGYLTRSDNVYRSNPCFVYLDPDDAYEFHVRLKDPRALLEALVFGQASVARGLQYVGRSQTKLGNFGVGLYRRFLH